MLVSVSCKTSRSQHMPARILKVYSLQSSPGIRHVLSPDNLITTFLFQWGILGAASGSGEGKLNAHSKDRGGGGEPPVGCFQCVLQLATTSSWFPPPMTSQITLFCTLSFRLFFRFFFSPLYLTLEPVFEIVSLYLTRTFSFTGQNRLSQNSNFQPCLLPRNWSFPCAIRLASSS